jgi:hypothetical protein
MSTQRRLVSTTACALALVAVCATAAPASTKDRPSAGRFAGEHSFNGSITLIFAREAGIGLYLAQYRLRGEQRCPSGERVAIAEDHRITARTAARVKSNRTFRLRQVVVRLDGRFTSSRRVTGSIEIRTSACETRGTFAATKRR